MKNRQRKKRHLRYTREIKKHEEVLKGLRLEEIAGENQKTCSGAVFK